MSKTNASRSRAQITRRRKLHKRERIRALRAQLAKREPEPAKPS
jgi:hypothetical protein